MFAYWYLLFRSKFLIQNASQRRENFQNIKLVQEAVEPNG